MSTNELNTTAKELLSIRSMIAELEAEAEALTDKLKADHADLYGQYSKQTTTTRFCVGA